MTNRTFGPLKRRAAMLTNHLYLRRHNIDITDLLVSIIYNFAKYVNIVRLYLLRFYIGFTIIG